MLFDFSSDYGGSEIGWRIDGIITVILFDSPSDCGEVEYDDGNVTVILFDSPSDCGKVEYDDGNVTVILFHSPPKASTRNLLEI